MTSWIELRPREVVLRLRVQPRAARPGVAGVAYDRLRIRVSEPPAGGQANAAVVRLLAGLAGVPKSAVVVSQGAAGREKTLRISTVDPQATAARLLAAAGA